MFDANFYGIDGKKQELKSEEEVKRCITQAIKVINLMLQSVKKKERKRNPVTSFYHIISSTRSSTKIKLSSKENDDDCSTAI